MKSACFNALLPVVGSLIAMIALTVVMTSVA